MKYLFRSYIKTLSALAALSAPRRASCVRLSLAALLSSLINHSYKKNFDAALDDDSLF